jgi:hypothetical protein
MHYAMNLPSTHCFLHVVSEKPQNLEIREEFQAGEMSRVLQIRTLHLLAQCFHALIICFSTY